MIARRVSRCRGWGLRRRWAGTCRGRAYSGSATIEPREGSITLNERRGDHELTATGTVEAPSPGEWRVLRLHWQTAAPGHVLPVRGRPRQLCAAELLFVARRLRPQATGARSAIPDRGLAQSLSGRDRPDYCPEGGLY